MVDCLLCNVDNIPEGDWEQHAESDAHGAAIVQWATANTLLLRIEMPDDGQARLTEQWLRWCLRCGAAMLSRVMFWVCLEARANQLYDPMYLSRHAARAVIFSINLELGNNLQIAPAAGGAYSWPRWSP